MIKKLLFLLFALFFCIGANAAEMVNVEYIHKLIKQQWDFDLPYNPALTNPKVAANMKYLLTAVDRTNEILNGEATTSYGTGEYATMAAADTVATIDAVERLVFDPRPKFFVTTMPNPGTFYITIAAKGKFYIDWGDESPVQEIVSTSTTKTTYSHPYASVAGKSYTIGIGGRATEYTSDMTTASISFRTGCSNIAAIDGSLGAVFRSINGGGVGGINANSNYLQPRFADTFYRCTNLTSIPEELFKGIKGHPGGYMFYRMFAGCTNLTEIPAGLFADIRGKLTYGIFTETFASCSNLTEIPSGLFSGLSGKADYGTFLSTFSGCRKLEKIPGNLFSGVVGISSNSAFHSTFTNCTALTELPDGLFGNISGDLKAGTFKNTFAGCSNLTSIPEHLFGKNISSAWANKMFEGTFSGCTSLTGPSARINGRYLYEIWPDADTTYVGGCYKNASGLTDWAEIPDDWK